MIAVLTMFLNVLHGRAQRRQEETRYGGPPRRRVPRWAIWTAVLAVVTWLFRKAVAAAVVGLLSVPMHWFGVNLPHLKFEMPWTSIARGTTTNVDLGPWVLQKIEGISRPALGQANFTFTFTHKVTKNIGPWPCWYQSTFYAVGHASATVDLNPGPAWWAKATGHYQLQVLSGHRVAVTMVLPKPQLPTSAHQVVIDNLPSQPIDTQHSWTYPGFGCGVVIKPQFPESVLYSEAQQIAFYKATKSRWVTGAMVHAAEDEATAMLRDNFIQPTVNAFGYTLTRFTIRWA